MNAKSNVRQLPQDKSRTSIFHPYHENRKRLAAQRDRIREIESAIAAAQAVEARALERAPTSEILKQQAEDLAAAVALGQAAPADVEKRRTEIKNLEAALAKGLAEARAAQETRGGLERALLKVQEDVKSLEEEGRALIEQALCELAEETWTDYVELGRVVRDAFIKLMALNVLLPRIAGRPGSAIARTEERAFFLPAFELSGVEDLTHPGTRGELFSDSGYPLSHHIEEAVNFEAARLRELGVEL